MRPETASAASFAFIVLAVISAFLMMRSDRIARRAIVGLKRAGLRDLDHVHAEAEAEGEGHGKHRILILGFFRVASSLMSEIERNHPALLEHVCVVDFNPNVFHTLRSRNIKIVYGDVAHADTLNHAGLASAEIVISTVPDSLLKGTTNEKIVRHIRAINPAAKIIATADVLAEAQRLYASGADYVTIARLAEANELIDAINAAEGGLLEEMRANLDARLKDRREVLP
jgi:voltage-gated potassium channel Kch